MRRVLLAVAAILLLGAGSGTRLLAQAQPPAGLPSLAILPLKEEGRKDLGDLSDTLNMCVATAFGDSGGFRLVEPGKVQAALADLKLPAGPVDPASVPPLGKRLGAQYVLMGSYLPETNLAKGAVTVTVTLRLTDAADGSVVKNILEVGEGSSLGGAVAALVR
jgi:TolB-like protein